MNTPDRGCYRPIDEWKCGALKGIAFPTEAEQKEVNGFFKRYIFFKNIPGGRELTTSCCGKHEAHWDTYQRTMGDVEYGISYGAHNDHATCPFCGAGVTLKEIRRLGKRKRLREYQPIVFLKARRGQLTAIGGWAMKDYLAELNEAPVFKITSCYRFKPGQAEQIYKDAFGAWGSRKIAGDFNPNQRTITEPVAESTFYYNEIYCSYHVIGIEAIERTSFKYCQYDAFARRCSIQREGGYPEMHDDLIKFLSLCCIFPRAVEMLIKGGMPQIVSDMVCYRKKNSYLVKWGEDNPQLALGLNGQELKAFMATKRDPDVLEAYKRMRSAKFSPSFEFAAKLDEALSYETTAFIAKCRKVKVKPQRLLSYLEKYEGPRCCGAGYYSIINAFAEWKDYIDFAQTLGYDLTAEPVLLPKNLHTAHDAATQELTQRLDIEATKENQTPDELFALAKRRASAVDRLAKWQKKYDFELDGLIVRTAMTEREIVEEGKALQHCVGGYASRHMEGSVTILFLRSSAEPNKPMVTVEMNGNRIKQIHGFQNERDGSPSPRTAYKKFLDAWLKWLDEGSKRTENGRPIVSKKPKKKQEAKPAPVSAA